MLKLWVDRKVESATVVLRWCIDKAVYDQLKKWEIEAPYLLVVIYNEHSWRRSEHFLVPLSQMTEYFQLRYPGENKIFATIVWDNAEGHKGLWKKYIQRVNNSYNTDLVYCAGSDPYVIPPDPSLEKAELDIVVPQGLFAQEPPEWQKRWVNLWFETRPKDQCQFRKRKWTIAYTIQPWVMLLWFALKMTFRWAIAACCLALGYWLDFEGKDPRKWKPLLDLRPLIHPWKMDIDDMFDSDFRREFGDHPIGSLIVNSAYVVAIVMAIIGLVTLVGLIFRGLNFLAEKPFRSIGRLFRPIAEKVKVRLLAWADSAADRMSRIPVKRKTILNVFLALICVALLMTALLGETGGGQPDSGRTKYRTAMGMTAAFYLAAIAAYQIASRMSRKAEKNTPRSFMTPAAIARREARIEKQLEPFQALLCENVAMVDPKKAAPLPQKVHLYYQDLKYLVCKPFAG